MAAHLHHQVSKKIPTVNHKSRKKRKAEDTASFENQSISSKKTRGEKTPSTVAEGKISPSEDSVFEENVSCEKQAKNCIKTANNLKSAGLPNKTKKKSSSRPSLGPVTEKNMNGQNCETTSKLKSTKGNRKPPKSVKDKNAPKRRRSAYNYFTMLRREEILAETPDLKFSEITRIVSAEWAKMNPEMRKVSPFFNYFILFHLFSLMI